MFEKHDYPTHIKTVVENNPTAVAARMVAAGNYVGSTVSPKQFVEYLSSSRSTEPAELATLVATLLDVQVNPLGDHAEYLSQILAANPTLTLKSIGYSVALDWFSDKVKKVHPSVLDAWTRGDDVSIRTDKSKYVWLLIAGLVLIAVAGGFIYVMKLIFGSKK